MDSIWKKKTKNKNKKKKNRPSQTKEGAPFVINNQNVETFKCSRVQILGPLVVNTAGR